MDEFCMAIGDFEEEYVSVKVIQGMLIERMLAGMYTRLGWQEDNAMEMLIKCIRLRRLEERDEAQGDHESLTIPVRI